MLTSARWLNDYLDPPATPEEQADLLTRAGFPLEATEEVKVSDGIDRRQDFELTSNRGDCVCHVGLAREIAAISGRALTVPHSQPSRGRAKATQHIAIVNERHDLCPRYTGRVIRGLKVGPSPAWLADRLVARGDIPRNNVVDATNFVLFELGQPTHTFDLATLRGGRIVVRTARADEPFLPIGEGEREIRLSPQDLVIADAERAVALAGVKGGALTAVTALTTDILIEAASFDPVFVRNSSRRLGIASESSYRFERGVAPGQVDAAAERLAEIILDVAGGELLDGVAAGGAPIPPRRRVALRPDRCRRILGVPVTDEEMIVALAALGFEPALRGDRLECVVPVHRLDVEREIDLIEEVGRMHGHDRIPVQERVRIRVAAPQPTEQARIKVADELVGLGFVETVTHSLIALDDAAPFMAPGAEPIRVRATAAAPDQVLQPSVLPGLLRVYRHNRDNGVERVRLFESAATFALAQGRHDERVRLGLVMDVDDPGAGLRPLRGAVERLVELLRGTTAGLAVAADDGTSWLRAGAAARATLDGAPLGVWGLLGEAPARRFGIEEPLLAGELDLPRLYAAYPPETVARALPSFPAIERDLSLVVDGRLAWGEVEAAVVALGLDQLESCRFVVTFRGAGIAAGRKSLTLRLCFRAPDRTLTHEEVDPLVERVVETMAARFRAEIRR